MREFYKTVFTVTVLSDVEPSPDINLESINYQITVGDWSGQVEKGQPERLTPRQMAAALREQGSDPSFLGLEECEECGGSGILFDTQSLPAHTIERCDACKQFESDEEAMAFVRSLVEDQPTTKDES
jgi:hypothetical protein